MENFFDKTYLKINKYLKYCSKNFARLCRPFSFDHLFWLHQISICAVTFILLKLFMLYALGSFVTAKLCFISMTLRYLFFYSGLFDRDFQQNPFSWTEFYDFFVFSFQITIFTFCSSWDIFTYFSYHRHGIPCYYLGEVFDLILDNFFISFGRLFSYIYSYFF